MLELLPVHDALHTLRLFTVKLRGTIMLHDAGANLRSLYKTQGGIAKIFSAKVADYVASRPDYPAQLFERLREECQLQPGSSIADIGAGTGLLTQGLLARGYSVVAVEPSAEMRAAADHLLAGHHGYRSVPGTAEAIPLPAASVDLITAAQAFHWFDIKAAKSEFLRLLRPQRKVALIWNDRVLTDPVHVELGEVFEKYGGAKRGALLAHEDRKDVSRFFGKNVPVEITWPHEHRLDEAGLLSLVFSRSYMPDRTCAAGQEAGEHVRQIFRRQAVGGLLTVRYQTIAIVGRLE